ncbi:hypothetical protein [Hyalangium gracile]|uniref:hypothetical protein n=1 Tax=Hyalangium gracile TaxID=394092 RepID=UPI001CCF40F9|nr:hypothetical protein [Hyalangium gracile]
MRQLWVLLASLLFSIPVLAQIEPPDAPKVADDGGVPRVYYAHSYTEGEWNIANLNDQISIHVQNFASLLQQTSNNCNGLILFIDGMAIKGLQPISCDVGSGHVRYRLLRTPQSDDTWHVLLGSPSRYLRPVSISVGSTDQFSISSSVTNFQLEIIPRPMLFLFSGVLLAAGLIFFHLCRKGGLIRSGSPTVPVTRRPYNLALFQMAFWFFLVVVAYVFIWMINGELDTITDSVLALLGIGTGTALASSLIDKSKQPLALQGSSAVPAEAGKPLETRGFLNDVLTDETGNLSLYRFQLFVWTLVLGIIFCTSVYKGLAMPEFSSTLLGLMGISSGTYVGFKVPEGKKEAQLATAAPAAAPAAAPEAGEPG